MSKKKRKGTTESSPGSGSGAAPKPEARGPRPEAPAATAAPATEAAGGTTSPPEQRGPLRYVVYGTAGAVAAILAVLFALALPDALARTREGARRDVELPCEELKPASSNATLGRLPVPAPDFTLKDFSGRTYKLSQFRGQVVLVNFWATWCKTCVVEVPSMERLVDKMRGKPFRLLAVSVDDNWEAIRKFFPGGTPLEILLDTEKSVPHAWGTDKFPESFLIDPDGNIRYYIISDRDWSRPEVTACINSMLK